MQRAALLFVLLIGLPLAANAAAPAKADPARSLAQAQERIDAGDPKAALPLLDALLRQDPANSRALLLRSTARFLTDDLAGGTQDLDRSLQLDPTQRQAWLHRAALAVANKQYDSALQAFGEAEKLDPQALDNDVNVGAVLLLQSKLEAASGRFQKYLARNPGSADAAYLVATNYAMAGYAQLAVENLRRAVETDERARLRARTDPNFAALAQNPRFQELLTTDGYRLPPGAHFAAQLYDLPYDAEKGSLVGAVLAALRSVGERFDPRVESTPDWALIWGELRIKVTGTPEGKGKVEVSAPVESLTAAAWQQRTEKLFRALTVEVFSRRMAGTKKREAPPG